LLATRTLAAAHLAPALRLSSGLVLFGAVQGAYMGALSGFEAFRSVAWVNCISGVMALPVTVFGCALGGLQGAIWGLIFQLAASCVFAHSALMKELRKAGINLKFSIGLQDIRLLWTFTLPAFLSTILATPAGWFCRTLLVNQKEGYAQAALVSAANQWVNLVTFLPWMLGGVLVPMFASLYARKRYSEMKKLLGYNLLFNAGVSLALIVPLAIFSKQILALYGPSFCEGSLLFVIAVATALFGGLNSLLSRSLQSANKAWVDLASNAIWALAVLAGGCLLIPNHKGTGLVIAQGIAALVLGVWQAIVVHRLLFETNTRAAGSPMDLAVLADQ